MQSEFSKLVNQKLSFAKVMVGELEALVTAANGVGSSVDFDASVRKNRRLYQAKIESVMHHLSTALMVYFLEIDAFDDLTVTAELQSKFLESIHLDSDSSQNPSLEELKILYQTPNSVIRLIFNFSGTVTQQIQSYELPGDEFIDSSENSNIIAIDRVAVSDASVNITIQTLVVMVEELETLISRQRSMSIEH